MSKNIYDPSVVVASQKGSVIHIKSEETGKVILKLKLTADRFDDDELLMELCGDSHTGYNQTPSAAVAIAEFEAKFKTDAARKAEVTHG